MPAPLLACYPRIVARPRIVILISTRLVGGPAKGLLQVIPELVSRRRFEIILCTFANRSERDSPFVKACRERNIDVQVLRQRSHFDYAPLAVLRQMLSPPCSALQTHGYKEAVFGRLCQRMTGRPWIAFEHGTTEENLKVRLYHRLDRLLVRKADAIVAVSRELADRTIRSADRQRLTIIENAIDCNTLVSRSDGRVLRERWQLAGPVVGCIGRLSREKGQAILIEAAVRLVRQGAVFTLVFAGDGPDRDRLVEQVQRAGISERVRFLGQVRRMAELYSVLDLLVLPSFKEGMPNVILEGMQYGLPIVSTSVGAVPEMLVHGASGLLVRAGDALALARAIAALLSDTDKAHRMGQKAHTSLYPRFSPERRVQRFETLYGKVLELA
ncbi:MAG: glycosyltransferase [Acidiferrobacter sp.]